MEFRKHIAGLAVASMMVVGAGTVVGCHDDPQTPREATHDAADATRDAGHKAADATRDAGHKTADAVRDATN
jgi:hypothetical protein